MGQLIEYRYIAEVDGYVAAAPFATLSAAKACLRSFAANAESLEVRCYWTSEIVWSLRVDTPACADRVV